jgi:hypothetical protein
MAACTHLHQIRIGRPAEIAGCEEWCYLDEVAFVLESDRLGGG